MAYSSIVKPSDYFNTKLYTGSNSTQSVTGVGFQPDLVWIKNRSSTPDHMLNDAVRTAGKQINSNTTTAELDRTYFQSFNSDGFSLEGNVSDYNQSGSNFASWNWKANGQGSSNTAGSINTTYTSVNTTAGFSIVSYTGTGSSGATIGHGLGVAPNMIIARRRNGVEDWAVYHKTLGATKYLHINNDAAEQTNSNRWNNTTPSATLITLGNHASINYNGGTHIAYCFAEKTGYSKFGTYTGNGNADGTFVYTGFKPAFVIFKRTSGTGNWQLLDNKRLGYNVENRTIYPNTNAAEQDEDDADLLSNGFKLRGSGTDGNGSGSTYIYMAFAEEPLVANSGSNGVPATAR